MKYASNALARKPYACLQAWPEDCKVQCGDAGIVFGTKGSLDKVISSENPLGELAAQATDPETYITAFFEAFPKPPVQTFIRGEGKTIEEAEEAAFKKYQKYAACDHSMGYERRDYKNGMGFCKGCGMSSSQAFLPSTTCVVCGIPTNWSSDIDENFYCEVHSSQMPEDKKHDLHKMVERSIKERKEKQKQQNQDQY